MLRKSSMRSTDKYIQNMFLHFLVPNSLQNLGRSVSQFQETKSKSKVHDSLHLAHNNQSMPKTAKSKSKVLRLLRNLHIEVQLLLSPLPATGKVDFRHLSRKMTKSENVHSAFASLRSRMHFEDLERCEGAANGSASATDAGQSNPKPKPLL